MQELAPDRQDSDPVLITRRGTVVIVTLNRPDRLNAISPGQAEHARRVFAELREDDTCRVVVLTGAGSSFCTGMDLSEGLGPSNARGDVQSRHLALTRSAELFYSLRELEQPVIAALHGHVVGAGLALAAMADLRIADTSARLSPVFTRRGFSGGDLGASWWLPRLVGFANAAEMLYTAAPFDAQRAREIGLVSQVVPAGTHLDAAIALAEQITANAPFAVAQTKELLNAAFGIGELRQHMAAEIRAQVLCSLTEDAAEGVMAAVQRRTPNFTYR
ncbi:enoyl-CoA hydratase/isomerase family protein [Nocardia vulneris]|uniref:enoyl-CoA hydratase/isomerase family protein n=1 Tax=Nocardia vulneris TaxID=1141657 RepID=UPI0030CC59B1